MTESFSGQALASVIGKTRTVVERGRLVQAVGTTVRVSGLRARIGQQCRISDRSTGQTITAEVVGLADGQAILLPLASLQGVALDAEIEVLQEQAMVPFSHSLLGYVLDSFGNPLDGRSLPADVSYQSVYAAAPSPLERPPIHKPFVTGVRSLDALLTLGVGQRMGIFAAAGGGKSTLLGMLARQSTADVNVIALIGERGREVREFLEDCLGENGRARSVVVVATSDRSAMERVRAAQTATAIAEGFRARGAHVLLLMDSVTRFARALREIGLSAGEPAGRQGFPPSVFAELPRLFERTGSDANGAITALYTVLNDDEETSDPVSEEVRSILDGHVVLSRKLGQAGHYPAIDVLRSASRVFGRVTSRDHQQQAAQARALLAKYAEIEFLLQVGEYKRGSDAVADQAIDKRDALSVFLKQHPEEFSGWEQTTASLREILK